MQRRLIDRGLAVIAAGLVYAAAAQGADEVNFSRDVRPILAKNCFKCHGPDEQTRESGLRLDTRTGATGAADSGNPAIVPGKPDESELVRRILAEDDGERMPPPEAKLALSEAQKETLKRWVASGAEYTEHWAFIAPRQPALPEVQDQNWPRNPIDNFLLAKLEAAGLSPAPPADRHTLVRRLYVDLIGLPPTPEEADAFVNDPAPNAYEALVDRLLESPHYGERWARRWLDLARYADTNGYEKDRPRSIWPYRDWVIDALNADMPFDQFTIEQLAGDMLPDATLAQRIATGFHRNTMLNEEGGIDPLEFRFHAMTDRVSTTGTTWLGLTVMCAQCHTHKYDPISHREYYGLMAFLDNADEPDLDLPDPALEQRSRDNLAEADRLLRELPDHWPPAEPEGPGPERRRAAIETRFAEWLARERERTVAWTPLTPVSARSNLPLLTVEEDGVVFAIGDTTKSDEYRLTFRPQMAGITSLLLEALPDERLPAHGPGMTYYEGTKGDFFLTEFQLTVDGHPVKFVRATESYAKNRFGSNPVGAAFTIDGDPQTGWSVDGRLGERHTAVFVLERPLQQLSELNLRMTFGRHFASSLGKFRISATTDPRGGEARDLPEEADRLLALPDEHLTAAQRDQLRTEFLLQAPELAKQAQAIRDLRKPLARSTTLVLQERPPENPRPTHVHHRGEFLQPTDQVEPGVPAVFPPLPDGAPRDRLTFARWLVARENPLTARVTVNRQWAAFFGRGLVRTPQDFGIQGEPPTHPELLDWLAVQFMEEGWSLKKLHKRIVMSAAYQQSSHVTPELLETDPDNRLLARAPRVRLEAEVLRDSVLAASGLLSRKIGGPSVYPPQPASVTTEGTYGALPWTPSAGQDRYRRSLYTFSKRTAPFAMFATFDGPSGEACVARRDVSNTPLQALTLLNDVMFTEAAQQLGRTTAAEPGSIEERAAALFRKCLTRPPEPEELAELVAFFESQRQRFAAGELNAAEVAGEGTGDEGERAAWTVLSRVVFNLDEMIARN